MTGNKDFKCPGCGHEGSEESDSIPFCLVMQRPVSYRVTKISMKDGKMDEILYYPYELEAYDEAEHAPELFCNNCGAGMSVPNDCSLDWDVS